MTRFGALLTATAALAAVVLAGCASARSADGSGGHPATHHQPTHSASHHAIAPSTSPPTTKPAAHTGRTVHHVFAAFGPGGAPVAGVTAHRPGSCFAASITVGAATAYRCLAGNMLFDPCFVVPHSGKRTVDCYADPWADALRLRLTRPLPTHGAPLAAADPWAMQLADGTKCVVTTGTSRLSNGIAMRYQCGSASAGLTKRTGPTIVAQVQRAGHAARRVPVAAVWTASIG